MAQIVLSEQQTELLVHAGGPVEVRDSFGNLVGQLGPMPDFTEEEITEAERDHASDQPRYTTQEVLAYLRSLDAA